MRQHVNPLSRFFQSDLVLPGLNDLFKISHLPLHLDIGCARGRFLFEISSLKKDWNYLGVEIRKPLVDAANRELAQLNQTNLNFLFCNANISLSNWLADLPKGLLKCVSVQFPDPWFKRRHYKRRIFQPELLISIANAISHEGDLFVQSDVLDVINPIKLLVESSHCFDLVEENNSPWLYKNPMLVPTERERYVLLNSMPIYRLLFRRNDKKVIEINELEFDSFSSRNFSCK